MTIQTVNPFDNKVINSFPEMGAEQINQAITKAHEAFLS